MTQFYEYVVLRLSPNLIRGESINIGVAVFRENGAAVVRLLAPISKIRAIDPTWNRARNDQLEIFLKTVIDSASSTQAKIQSLASLGYCISSEPGFFHATESALDEAIRDIVKRYVSTAASAERKPRKSRLHTDLSRWFKRLHLLGTDAEDLSHHRVVPHFPIPGNPDLKGDFVYKNGVYRITQTLDYSGSESGAHAKVAEACMKVMAAREAVNVWGDSTKKFAVVRVPEAVADIADKHLDLLYNSGFEIFNADQSRDLDRYEQIAFAH